MSREKFIAPKRREASLGVVRIFFSFSLSHLFNPPPQQQPPLQLARLRHPRGPGHGQPPSCRSRKRPHGIEARALSRGRGAVASQGLRQEGAGEQARCRCRCGWYRGDSWRRGRRLAAASSGTAAELSAALFLPAAASRRIATCAAPRPPPKGALSARRHERLHARPRRPLAHVQRRERNRNSSSSAAPRLQGRVGGTLLWDRNC